MLTVLDFEDYRYCRFCLDFEITRKLMSMGDVFIFLNVLQRAMVWYLASPHRDVRTVIHTVGHTVTMTLLPFAVQARVTILYTVCILLTES